MVFAICGFIGMIVGAILGYVISTGGGGTGHIPFVIHLAISIGFVGLWLGVVFSKKATAHE